MATARIATAGDVDAGTASDVSYREGIIAGILGATTIALWFFAIDLWNARPLYTPTVLGTALFRGGAGLESPDTLAIDGEMVFMFTWVHALVFAAVGGFAARLIAVAERNPSLGFGILLFFVYLEGAFLVASFIFAETVLHALAWPAVLVGNLLAAGAMAGYFWRRHPNLQIRP